MMVQLPILQATNPIPTQGQPAGGSAEGTGPSSFLHQLQAAMAGDGKVVRRTEEQPVAGTPAAGEPNAAVASAAPAGQETPLDPADRLAEEAHFSVAPVPPFLPAIPAIPLTGLPAAGAATNPQSAVMTTTAVESIVRGAAAAPPTASLPAQEPEVAAAPRSGRAAGKGTRKTSATDEPAPAFPAASAAITRNPSAESSPVTAESAVAAGGEGKGAASPVSRAEIPSAAVPRDPQAAAMDPKTTTNTAAEMSAATPVAAPAEIPPGETAGGAGSRQTARASLAERGEGMQVAATSIAPPPAAAAAGLAPGRGDFPAVSTPAAQPLISETVAGEALARQGAAAIDPVATAAGVGVPQNNSASPMRTAGASPVTVDVTGQLLPGSMAAPQTSVVAAAPGFHPSAPVVPTTGSRAQGARGERPMSLSDSRFAQVLSGGESAWAAGPPREDTSPATASSPTARTEMPLAAVSGEVLSDGRGAAPDGQPLTTAGQPLAGMENVAAESSRGPITARPAAADAPPSPALPEQPILDQVIARLSLPRGEREGRLTLRLHPEELGEIRVELVMEKEGLRAHLQAQNQQVQEVLEKNLPRLRDTLLEQGVRLEEVRVSADPQDRGGHGPFHEQHHRPASPWRTVPAAAAEGAPTVQPAAARAAGAQGLSLRI